MKIRTIAALAAGLMAVLALAWAGWLGAENKGLRDDLTASRERVATLEEARQRDERADRVKAGAVKAVTKDYNEHQVALEKAYDANEEWANQPIPPDVLDGLY